MRCLCVVESLSTHYYDSFVIFSSAHTVRMYTHTSRCMGGGLGSDGSGKTPFISASTVIAGQTEEDYDVRMVSISLQCVFNATQRTTTRRNIKSHFSDQVALKWKEVNFPSISKHINSLTVSSIEVDFFSVSKYFVTQFIVEWFIVSLWLFCFIRTGLWDGRCNCVDECWTFMISVKTSSAVILLHVMCCRWRSACFHERSMLYTVHGDMKRCVCDCNRIVLHNWQS